MNAVKRILIAGAAIAALATALPGNAAKDEITLPDNAVIYDCCDLTYDILTSRTSDITVVERIVGEVLNYDGDGRILNTDSEFNYISYKYVEDIHPGDIIVTYSIYNTANNYEDDITERYDMVVASDDLN